MLLRAAIASALLPASAMPLFGAEPAPNIRPRCALSPASRPGGASDAVARLLTQPLQGRLGQQVITDNRLSAGEKVAGEIAARSAPDGHTWFLGNNPILATNQALFSKMPFDSTRDFATAVLVGTQPSVVVVHP